MIFGLSRLFCACAPHYWGGARHGAVPLVCAERAVNAPWRVCIWLVLGWSPLVCSLRLGGHGAFCRLSVEGAPWRVLALSAPGVGVCLSAFGTSAFAYSVAVYCAVCEWSIFG